MRPSSNSRRRAIIFAIGALLAAPLQAGTYYVAPSATSTNWAAAASTDTPCTAATAFQNAIAGDTVLFRGGTYNIPPKNTGDWMTGYYNASHSGTAASPIIFKAHPNELPIFNGASGGSGDKDGQEYYGYSTLFSTSYQSYVTLDGFTFQSDGGTAQARIVVTGGDNSSTTRTTGCIIRNCTLSGGTLVSPSTDNREGLFISQTNDLTVSNCRIYNYRQASDWHNTSAIKTYHCSNVSVENCEIYNCPVGIFFKSDTDDSAIRYNYIHNNNEGILVTPDISPSMDTDRLAVYHNVIANNTQSGFTQTGEGSDSGTHGDDYKIYNNTFYNNGSRQCSVGYTTPGGNGVELYNNIFVGGTQSLITYDRTGWRNYLKASDHNQWSASFKTIRIGENLRNINYTSLAAWQASGQLENPYDAGGGLTRNPGYGDQSSDPKFANTSDSMAALADFALLPVSPCLGTGRSGANMGANVALVGPRSTFRHGDPITLIGNFGTQNVTKTFLGGAEGMIESQPVGGTMPNSNNWTFHTLGYTAAIKVDSTRGKVLFNPEDATHYNATRRYDSGAPIPEQRSLYKAYYVRNVMLLDGLPYTKCYQWKLERINWENNIEDGDGEIKVHNWLPTNGPICYVNRSHDDQSTYWGSPTEVPSSNGGWALFEIFIFTGTQGVTDGKVITRVHKNGHTVIGLNKQAERVYSNDPKLRFRYFIEQNFFGNFGQSEDGVDNPLPRPQIREVYSDDSQVIVGLDASSGSKRVELRDTVALNTATIRELQDWTSWSGNIDLRLNTGGIPPGEHDLYLVIIDGIDADGWDIVSYSQPVHIQVDPVVATPDTQAPTTPTSLAGATGSATTVSLSWTASTDNIDIAGYRIYRDGSLIGTTSARSYPDTRIILGQTYSYAVSAFDPAGNESARSATATVTAHDKASSYTAWRTAGFSWRDQPLDAVSGPLADPDGVGLSNFARYAFYLATRGTVAAPATLGTVNSGGQNYLTLTFNRRNVATGLSYILESSTDLVTWTPVPGQTYGPGTPTAITAQDSVAMGTTARRFLRLQVQALPYP